MGESTLIEGIVAGADSGSVAVDTAVGRIVVPGSPVAAGAAVALAIRPEHLVLGTAPADAAPLGAVRLGETMFQGSFVRGHAASLAAPGLDLLVKLPVARAPAPGEVVQAWAMPDDFALLTR
jgi:spermidine/putrescine transport system ATP-binding protein